MLVHLKNYSSVFETTLQKSNNSRGHSNFCINENYFKNWTPLFTIVRLMLMIIIKHNSLKHNNISMNKLKKQTFVTSKDLTRKCWEMPLLCYCRNMQSVRGKPDKTTKTPRDSECETLQQVAITKNREIIMNVWICKPFCECKNWEIPECILPFIRSCQDEIPDWTQNYF